MKSYLLLVLVFIVACSSTGNETLNDVTNTNENNASLWCVSDQFLAGGTFFPIMDNPSYNTVTEIESTNYLNDNSKLALLKINDQVYIYPYDYTNTFEVVNDNIDDNYFAISYCPITESALGLDRKLSTDEIISFKASGFLYKDNMVPSDVNSTYFWSQMLLTGLRESSKPIKLNTYNIVESTWLIAKTYFPDAKVFNHENILDCNCDETPNPIDFQNPFGVLEEIGSIFNLKGFKYIPHLFYYNNFLNGNKLKSITINNNKTIIVGNKNKIFFNAFYIPNTLTFNVLPENEFPNILKDNEGNIWDIFGYAILGPRKGQKLESPTSYVAAPWAWNEFFDDITYHN